MTMMEGLVRPFQSRTITPRPRSLSFNTQAPPPAGVLVEITGQGGKTFQYSVDFSSSFADATTANYNEVARVEETVRVVNPTDPTQFVDVKEALGVKFSADPKDRFGIDDQAQAITDDKVGSGDLIDDSQFLGKGKGVIQNLNMKYRKINQKIANPFDNA